MRRLLLRPISFGIFQGNQRVTEGSGEKASNPSERDQKFWSRNLLTTNDPISTADVTTLATWSEKYYRDVGIEPLVIWRNFERVVENVQSILNKNVRNASPSVFKRAAALTVAFTEAAPLSQSMSDGKLSSRLTSLNNHQNSIVVFDYCRRCLHGATLTHSEGEFKGKTFPLNKRIELSRHFYCDLIFTLGCEGRESRSYHLLTLLYETLAFKANPEASYKLTV
jgi:hypothetical protein